MFIQIIGIDDRDHADSNSYGHMMNELSDDEDYMSLYSGSGSGSGQITFGNKSLNVSSNPVTSIFEPCAWSVLVKHACNFANINMMDMS